MTDLTPFFEQAKEALARRGLSLYVGDDRPRFAELQRRWGHEPYPAFLPMIHAQVMTGIVRQGEEEIATVAAVPLALDGTLTAHLSRYGLHPGVTISLMGAARSIGNRIVDRAAFTGGLCMPADLRGSDLSGWLVPFLSLYIRAAMVHQYGCPCFFFVPEGKRARGERYKPERLERSVKFSDADELRLMGYASPEFIVEAARGSSST